MNTFIELNLKTVCLSYCGYFGKKHEKIWKKNYFQKKKFIKNR